MVSTNGKTNTYSPTGGDTMEFLKDQDLATLIHDQLANAHYDANQATLARGFGAVNRLRRTLWRVALVAIVVSLTLAWRLL
jgi:hypothetical protein